MFKRCAAACILAYLGSHSTSRGAEFEGAVGPGALTLGNVLTTAGQGLNQISNNVPGTAALRPVGVVLQNAGSIAPALANSQQTGQSFSAAYLERTADVNKGFLANQAGTKAAEWVGAPPIVAKKVGKELGKFASGEPQAATRAFQTDEIGSIGGIQNAVANNDGLFGGSGITQYNLLGNGTQGTSAANARNTRSGTRDRNPNPGDELIGPAPGSDGGLLDALFGGAVPMNSRQGRCGPGLHGPQIDTPSPQSCF